MKASDTRNQLPKNAIEKVDSTLRENGLVIVNVDYNNRGGGDHWVLITHKNSNGEYESIDPNGGRTVIFSRSPSSRNISTNAILYGHAHPQVTKAKDYKVIRFVALTAN